MRLLITGASGFIGQSLIRTCPDLSGLRLLQHQNPLSIVHAEAGQGDLEKPADCLRICQDVDCVIHAAGGKSHVIPSLFGKVAREEDPFEVWGSGREEWDFLYVDDLTACCHRAGQVSENFGCLRHPLSSEQPLEEVYEQDPFFVSTPRCEGSVSELAFRRNSE